MKFLFLFFALLSSVVSVAQPNEVLSKIPVTGSAIGAFIPNGFDTLMTATGDLDKDNVSDYVLVLKSVMEETDNLNDTMALPQRILLVLLNKGTSYELAAKTNSLIMGKQDGGVFGDPFAGITITKGILVVDHYGGSAWRWEYTHKFRYQNYAFFLIGQTSNNYWNVKMCTKLGVPAATDYEDVNFVTGSYVKKKVSEGCKLLENKKGKRTVTPLVKLDDFTIIN